mmetsp:Transcript_56180/g.131536  ORF Transcript_56180/g.131536 Transcript_56180/m.131536 type:complete len:269 (-) Transcript_56180:230-1036(-)
MPKPTPLLFWFWSRHSLGHLTCLLPCLPPFRPLWLDVTKLVHLCPLWLDVTKLVHLCLFGLATTLLGLGGLSGRCARGVRLTFLSSGRAPFGLAFGLCRLLWRAILRRACWLRAPSACCGTSCLLVVLFPNRTSLVLLSLLLSMVLCKVGLTPITRAWHLIAFTFCVLLKLLQLERCGLFPSRRSLLLFWGPRSSIASLVAQRGCCRAHCRDASRRPAITIIVMHDKPQLDAVQTQEVSVLFQRPQYFCPLSLSEVELTATRAHMARL